MKSNKQAKREAKQLFRLCQVNGLADQNRTEKVARAVAAAGYRDCHRILGHFLRLVTLDRARHTANIESSAPLPESLQAAIRDGLSRRFGPGLTTTFGERPELIGGVRIQVGSDVYDGSVRAGLAALEKSF